MTTLIRMLVFSRMKHRKARLLFVLLAIAASSCLIVWTIGGYQSLFGDAANQEADYRGAYDLKVGAPLGGGRPGMRGGFPGPFTSRPSSPDENRSRSNAEPQSENKRPSGERPGSGGPPASFTPPRTRLDTLRAADGRIELAGLPRELSSATRKLFTKADTNGDGFLDEKEQDAVPILRNKKKALLAQTQEGGPGMGGRGSGGPGSGGPGMGGPGMGGPGMGGPGMGGPGMGGRGSSIVLSRDLIDEIGKDPSTILCDEISFVTAFVYSKNMKSFFQTTNKTNNSNASPASEPVEDSSGSTADVPEGIEPDLHRRGLDYYRSVMGTPMGMGSGFMGTTAAQPPYDLKAGKWLDPKSEVPEAVLTESGAERYGARVGDSLLVMTKTKEYQIKIVGLVEDRLSDGFYVAMPIARNIAGSEPKIGALNLKLRVAAEEFRDRWNTKVQKDAPGAVMLTGLDIAEQKKAEAGQEGKMFRYQAISGTLLAVLASILIIFTSLNMSVDEQKRQFALYRMVGLTRGQVATAILVESLLLAIPGWLFGVATGWLLLWLGTGKVMTLKMSMIGFTFLCAATGAIVAALYPMLRAGFVRPLDAVANNAGVRSEGQRTRQIAAFTIFTVLGLLFLCADLMLVHVIPMATEKKALLHSGIGMLCLVAGVLCLVPVTVVAIERLFLPLLAFLFRFDRNMLRGELSGNMKRTVAVAVVLSIGGGLFVSMQIWGYSMLGPFLPGREMPDRFAAFLPVGLQPRFENELRRMPGVKRDEFYPVAVEQAALTQAQTSRGMGSQFANVVFFGMDVAKAFDGPRPPVTLRFTQGDRKTALETMKNGRGVVITDSIQVDYGLNVGDTLRVNHPRKEGTILEYPVVGVVAFPGWQWLSKTGGVRRNFGRSGGIVFANDTDIRKDYQLDTNSYFWFNSDDTRPQSEMEKDFDALAQKNLKASGEHETGQTAYVKLSTRQSLLNAISRRADSVIWGLCKMPLVTLVITGIAIVGVVINSARARRRQFGIMRAVGITRFALVRMILVEAVLIGLVAVAASFLFGFLAAQGALKLGQSMFGTTDPPLVMPWAGLAFGFGLILVLCLVAAVYPAYATSREAPIDLLQEGRGRN